MYWRHSASVIGAPLVSHTVLIVDKLPTTATGKLQRFAVREIAADLLAATDRPE